MRETTPTTTERVRAAEVIASMCLATDLGMGFPFEHAPRHSGNEAALRGLKIRWRG